MSNFSNGVELSIKANAGVRTPAKQQVPVNQAGDKVFKVGSGGDYDITGWAAICVTPSSANLTAYFNADSTKTFTIFSGQENWILLDPTVAQITFSGTDSSVEYGGM